MAVYAIGDIQGCYDPFRELLDAIDFDPGTDTLWLAGDLVSRGPKSLKTLRFVKSLGDSAMTVLGNHDLHLMALWVGSQRFGKRFGRKLAGENHTQRIGPSAGGVFLLKRHHVRGTHGSVLLFPTSAHAAA